jgi:methionyl-tRNA formyltransferase
MSSTAIPRVVLLTSPGTYGSIIINTLAEHAGVELLGVGLTNRVYRNTGLIGTVRKSVQRMGWRYTAYNALASNVAWTVLQLGKRPSGLAACQQNVRPIDDVNSKETLAWLNEIKPDYVASFYFNQWIGADVRSLPKHDCVNVHPSLLPAFKGPDPVFRALQRGVTDIGLTIHRVADDFDAGTILHQVGHTIDLTSSVFSVYCECANRGAKLLGDWLAAGGQVNETTAPLPDKTTEAEQDDYATFPTAAEVRDFVQSGGTLIRMKELRQTLREIS